MRLIDADSLKSKVRKDTIEGLVMRVGIDNEPTVNIKWSAMDGFMLGVPVGVIIMGIAVMLGGIM